MLLSYPQHGYAILAEIHKNFGVLLSPGLLYPLLYEFEAKGWVETIDDNRKKVYRLTVKGVKKTEQLKSFYMKSFKQLIKFMG
jgi:DNA-binding PadR family transcriptional regulator